MTARALVLLAVLLLAVPSAGAAPLDFAGPRAVAMGAHRAVGTGNETIFLNPAGLGTAQRYTIQVDYANLGPSRLPGSGQGINLSVVDSLSNPKLPTGIAYRHLWLEEDGRKWSGLITDLAMAAALSPGILVGGRMSYLYRGVEGGSSHQVTADAGLMFFNGPLSVGIVGNNILGLQSFETPRTFAAGASFGTDLTFRLAADYRLEEREAGMAQLFAGGGEVLLFEAVPVRLGYVWDHARRSGVWSAGAGFVSRTFGADLGARYDPMTGERLIILALKLFGPW